MDNLGKANVKIYASEQLSGIKKDAVKYNFDINAFQYDSMQKSPYFPPFLFEHIEDSDESFGVMFPSKRKYYIDNYIEYNNGTSTNNSSTSTTIPYITFKAIGPDQSGASNVLNNQGIVTDLFSSAQTDQNPNPFDGYVLEQPQQNGTYSTDYIGPKWENAVFPKISATNDTIAIKTFLTLLGLTEAASTWSEDEETRDYMGWINQYTVRDGLWWGVESSSFLYENMPFWVNLNIMRTPSTKNHETLFIISLGNDNNEQSFDIFLSQNSKPKIIDYYNGRQNCSLQGSNGTGPQAPDPTLTGANYIVKEFDNDFSRILDTQKDIEIGVMTIAGRLIVTINDTPLIYTRVEKTEGDDAGTLKECKIASGKIRIWGTNVQAVVNVSPMTFAPLAAFAAPLPKIQTENNNNEGNPPTLTSVNYKGVKNDGTYSGSVGVLPTQPDVTQKVYGVDCKDFTDMNETIHPTGLGLHKKGYAYFDSYDSISNESGGGDPNALPSTDFYIFYTRCEDTTFTAGSGTVTIKNGGCPFFFRLKGGYEPPTISVTYLNPITDILNITETSSAPDYFCSTSNVTITLYNKNGIYDYFKEKQYGITVHWGWKTGSKKTFTGLVVNATTSEVPGKETITLQCEDYMYILKNTPIINSPFYDGMVMFNAIEDLAKRAGVKEIVDEMDSSEDYFLPSGYTFTKPAMRFPSKNMIFNCIMDIVKRAEAFIYFNEEGKLIVNKLPGGLFSNPTEISGEFTRNPDAEVSKVILNEKNVQYDYNSTVNKISIFTLDRDTRNAIIYSKGAEENDHLAYKRIHLLDQPALGSLDVARTYAERLGMRVFYPILKTSFSTVGTTDATINKVLDFIKIDGQEFRLTSVAKKYNSDNNDFTVDYSAEWLGGNGQTVGDSGSDVTPIGGTPPGVTPVNGTPPGVTPIGG